MKPVNDTIQSRDVSAMPLDRLVAIAILLGALFLPPSVRAAGQKASARSIEERMQEHVNYDLTLDRIPIGSPTDWKKKYSRIDWIRKADRPFPLKPPSAPFSVRYRHRGQTYGLDDYFKHGDTLAFLVLKDDQIVFERYLHGTTENDRFASMSVAKSIVSILIGVAVDEGRIRSVQDPIVRYLPYLKKGGFATATVEDVLRMASGVDYSENYGDKSSGISRLGHAFWTGKPTFAEFAASLPSEILPGTKIRYQSVNTQVLGLLLERVTGRPLYRYAAEKLWKKIGTESKAFIATGKRQPNTVAYSGFNATLRDYGRVGLMAMRRGKLGATRVVSEEWIRASTTPAPFSQPRLHPKTKQSSDGYGYQWWLPYDEDGNRAFKAVGIKGQTIYVNPEKRIVIAQFSAWPSAGVTRKHYGEKNAVFAAIVKKLAGN